MFDPWTATIEDALGEHKRWLASELASKSPHDPLLQTISAWIVISIKDAVDGGNGFAVMEAMSRCASHGLVAPAWLAIAFNRRYNAVLDYSATSWDDPRSFGKPYPKGTNKAAKAKARRRRFEVFNAVVDRLKRDPDTPIDKELFESIGSVMRPPIGGTLASEDYAKTKKDLGISDIRRAGPLIAIYDSAEN